MLSVIFTLSLGSLAIANAPGYSQDSAHYQPNDILNKFLVSVDRGELFCLEEAVNRGMIEPQHIEFVYQINGSLSPTIKIYSRLIQAREVPNQNKFIITGLSALLSADGSILQSIAHVKSVPNTFSGIGAVSE